MSRKVTAALLITAAVLTNAAFTVLGMVFNYPDVLKEPVEEILAAFRASQTAVDRSGSPCWPSRPHCSRPIAIGVGRLSDPSRDAGRRAGRHRRRGRPGHRPVPMAAAGAGFRRRRGQP